ncbi:hypothetical protein HMPREF9057_01927 [Actinomyces sp. oral taxon 171 str. F0337]|nr:hypothetical protein HMPREF9057_01927 [Actinomyces sp. oral taxon 171 str. F0337]
MAGYDAVGMTSFLSLGDDDQDPHQCERKQSMTPTKWSCQARKQKDETVDMRAPT